MDRFLYLGACGFLAITYAGSMASANPIYNYDGRLGLCVDATGQAGYNSLEENSLFSNGTVSGSRQVTFTGGDAECVDFSGFNLNKYLRTQGYRPYFALNHWNLRGAKFDQANFGWTVLTDADLSGAKLDQLVMGYTTIHGKVDAYTELNSVCTVDDGNVECVH